MNAATGGANSAGDWQPHSPKSLQYMLNHLEELKRQGIEAIDCSRPPPSLDDAGRSRSSCVWEPVPVAS